MKVMLGTRNNGKIVEMRRLLEPLGLELENQTDTDIPSPVEDSATFVENALIKARAVSLASALPAIADDSGLVVPALNDARHLSSRFAHADATDTENTTNAQPWQTSVTISVFFCCMVMLRHAIDPTPIIATGNGGEKFLPRLKVTADLATTHYSLSPATTVAPHNCQRTLKTS